MAKEVKSMDVHPDNEASTIELMQSFGWEFHSTQAVSENYQERRGDTIYQVRSRSIKLTFQREKTMNNYNELVSLENQYNSIYDPMMPEKFGRLWGIATIIGLCWLIPGIIIIIWRCKKYAKEYPVWEEKMDENMRKRAEIIKRAKALL